jgi:F0F1-type ATP synthase alpha subunit
MKKVAGTLKLDQALYREMEAFSKFGGDLDATTKLVLDKGARNVEILKQPQYEPVAVEKQVAIIYLGTQGLLREVPVKKIKAFEEHFLMELDNKLPEVLGPRRAASLTNLSVNSSARRKNSFHSISSLKLLKNLRRNLEIFYQMFAIQAILRFYLFSANTCILKTSAIGSSSSVPTS